MRDAMEKIEKRLSEPQRRDAQAEIESAVEAKRVSAAPIKVPRLGDVTVDPETVFVLMPFKGLDDVFVVIREAAEEAGLRIFRADAISAAGSIIDQIFESIAKSGLIVADLTGRNQNVMYELGLANAMGKDTVLLSQGMDYVPFDVRNQRVLTYKLSPKSLRELRDRLIDAFRHYRAKTA